MADKATPTEAEVSSEEIRGMCGDISDWKVSAIAALSPTAADIELAVVWADGQDEARPRAFLEGKSAQVFEILTADEEVEDDR